MKKSNFYINSPHKGTSKFDFSRFPYIIFQDEDTMKNLFITAAFVLLAAAMIAFSAL